MTDTCPAVTPRSPLPCARSIDHEGDHRDVVGRSWPRLIVVDGSAPDDLSPRALELQDLQRTADALWARILGGDDTPRLRERVTRLEDLQAALIWEAPEMFAACGHCGRVPEARAA
ncbi:hypothetical protein ACIBL8_41385 [Streptomyces sp. NPDC050523]|uniref:hypothetical protein n=1 Tax=Streptomyces sp. NPDC050523 TaxID=3365622 RepID=UPI0037AA4841